MKIVYSTLMLFTLILFSQCKKEHKCIDSAKAQRAITLFCLDTEDPVCGCDGKTYKNVCYADKAGVVHYVKGPCKKENLCMDSSIAKKAISLMCVQTIDPVCGCDGKTYQNICYADKAGVVRYVKGSCPEK